MLLRDKLRILATISLALSVVSLADLLWPRACRAETDKARAGGVPRAARRNPPAVSDGDDERVAAAYKHLLYFRSNEAISLLAGPLVEALNSGSRESNARAARYLLLIAAAFRASDNERGAAECALVAGRLDPANTQAPALAAEYLVRSGRVFEARPILAKLSRLKDLSCVVLRSRAFYKVTQGDLEGATELLQQALKLDADDVKSLIRLSGIAGATGDRTATSAYLRQAAAVCQSPYQREILLASAEENLQAAEKHFAQAGKLNPDDPLWLNCRAVTYGNHGMHAKAAADFQAALSCRRQPADSRIKYAILLALQQQDARANALFDQVEKTKPDSPNLHHARGVIHKLRGREKEAQDSFEKALRFNPLNSSTYLQLSQLSGFQKSPDRLADLARRWTDNCPRAGPAWLTLGHALIRCGNWKEARQSLEKAAPLIELRQKDPAYALNKCLAKAGHSYCSYQARSREDALAFAKEFNASRPRPQQEALPMRPPIIDFASLASEPRKRKAAEHAVLADVLYEFHDLAGAEHEYREALAFEPNNINWHAALLKVLLDKKDFLAAAREDAIVSQHMISRIPQAIDGLVKGPKKR